MAAQNNATLAREIYEAFNSRDFQRVLDRANADVEIVFHPAGQTSHGHAGFTDFMKGFASAFPDGKITVTNQVASGDQVANEFRFTGTHTGTLVTPQGEVPPTGRTLDATICEVWTIKSGKLASLRNYQDMMAFMRQLGLV